MRHLFLLLFVAALAKVGISQTIFRLTDFSTGFVRPVDIAHAGDTRLFIVEQRGKIWMVDEKGQRIGSVPFLDIETNVRSGTGGSEQGLLGLAFHPNYAANGFFFVNYILRSNGNSRVARFRRSNNDPNVADPASETVLLEVTQPFSNHNGGCLKFGPDGYLYAGFGDGGSAGDPQNAGQSTNTFLGKMLRLDADNPVAGRAYGIPPTNPFVQQTGYLPEIWSLGWRNPWRFSFDRQTGDLWVGDVGQNAREEIDVEPAGKGGLNYGWRCREGSLNFNAINCAPLASFAPPIHDYVNNTNEDGCSVTGGFVYRGKQYPNLFGLYLFADYCSGRWWSLQRDNNGMVAVARIGNERRAEFSSLGEDAAGELYAAGLASGKIYRIQGQTVSTQDVSQLVQRFAVQPNPISDHAATVTWVLDQPRTVRLLLTDVQGRTVWTQTIPQQYAAHTFTLPTAVSGLYFVHLLIDQQIAASRKLVCL